MLRVVGISMHSDKIKNCNDDQNKQCTIGGRLWNSFHHDISLSNLLHLARKNETCVSARDGRSKENNVK